MPEHKKAWRGKQLRVDRGEAAMTWSEIATALGYPPGERGRKAVFMVYSHAMQKLRARPAAFRRVRELAAAAAAQRASREQLLEDSRG